MSDVTLEAELTFVKTPTEQETIKATIEALEEKLAKLQAKETYAQPARELFAQYTAFIDAGFSEENAFELLKVALATLGGNPPSYPGRF